MIIYAINRIEFKKLLTNLFTYHACWHKCTHRLTHLYSTNNHNKVDGQRQNKNTLQSIAKLKSYDTQNLLDRKDTCTNKTLDRITQSFQMMSIYVDMRLVFYPIFCMQIKGIGNM